MSAATEKPRWIEAGGDIQIPFMMAARKVLGGEPVPCPRPHTPTNLRFYYHLMNPSRGTGTVWAWCPTCFTTCHLPRVAPAKVTQTDPFARLSLEQFAALEVDPRERFLDRLNRLWDEGKLG